MPCDKAKRLTHLECGNSVSLAGPIVASGQNTVHRPDALTACAANDGCVPCDNPHEAKLGRPDASTVLS